jgi:alcohol dehydrogenase class IV
MQFEFSTATRILFGEGIRARLGNLALEFGNRALLITGIPDNAAAGINDILEQSLLETIIYPIAGEPTIEVIQRGVQLAKELEADLIIGLGGGSAIDCAKAIAVILTNPGDLTDYLEVVGQGKTITTPPVPIIAIPTTAGTGAEVTMNAVIGASDFGVKVSLRSPLLFPRLALIDPEMTYSMPPDLTASTGLDALTQLIEPYVCNASNPITDSLCREGISRSARALLTAVRNGMNVEARQDLCIASLFSGMALANARLGAVHGFAGVLGGALSIPHGMICTCLLPIVMEINLRAIKTRLPESNIINRYREIACLVTNNPFATDNECVEWVKQLCALLEIQSLGKFGLRKSMFPEVIEKSSKASSMKGNPVVLTSEEMFEVLERAM